MTPSPAHHQSKPSAAAQPEVLIYTDGGCAPNPGSGGWAAILISTANGNRKEISGAEAASTNNRMELTAALEAFRTLKRPASVRLTTDSQYLKNAFTAGWIDKWQRNGWRTASRQPVKNEDLWRALIEIMEPHQIEWAWVRGHSGHPENERCDELVGLAREKL